MATTEPRRRIDVRSELYDELERKANWLHMPATALAAMLITEGLQRLDREASRLSAEVEEQRRFAPNQAPLNSFDAAFTRRLREEASSGR